MDGRLWLYFWGADTSGAITYTYSGRLDANSARLLARSRRPRRLRSEITGVDWAAGPLRPNAQPPQHFRPDTGIAVASASLVAESYVDQAAVRYAAPCGLAVSEAVMRSQCRSALVQQHFAAAAQMVTRSGRAASPAEFWPDLIARDDDAVLELLAAIDFDERELISPFTG